MYINSEECVGPFATGCCSGASRSPPYPPKALAAAIWDLVRASGRAEKKKKKVWCLVMIRKKTARGSCANYWMSRDTGTRAETWRGLKGTTLSIYRLVRDLVALKSLMIRCFLQHGMFYNGTSNSRKFVRASERPPTVHGRAHQHNRFDYDGNISKTMYASAYLPIYTHPPTAIKPRTSSSAARFK